MKAYHRIGLILTGVGVLLCSALVVGLVVFFNSADRQKGYQPGDGPEATAYNYLMALVKKEYRHAYGYLSPTLPHYPEDLGMFTRDLEEHDLLPVVVAHGTIFRPSELPGFIASCEGGPVGLVTYYIERNDCEIVTLNSIRKGSGVGSALLERVKRAARESGCSRVWLITTNDNLAALRFYQRRGFHLVRVYPGAVDESRKLKPEIPQVGEDGIPIRDEIELEMLLNEPI